MWWKTKFKTKGELVRRIREIATRPVDVPLPPDEDALMRWVLSHHAEWTHSSSPIIPRFVWSHGKRTVCFQVDGRHFSWVVALKNGGVCSAKENVAAAARREIAPQIAAARSAARGLPCSICGEPLLEDTHVDHEYPTFDALLTEFVATLSGGYESIEIEAVDGIETRFADRDLAKSWHVWHYDRARLRLIHASENLRRSM